MNLLERDLRMFARFGVEADLLELARINRVTDHEARTILSINGRAGDMAGISFPYPSYYDGHILAYRVRRDNPEIENGKPRDKYLSSYNDGSHLYLPPGFAESLKDSSTAIVIVESEKATLALDAMHRRLNIRRLAVGLGGVWGWRGRIGKIENEHGIRVDEKGPLPELELCRNRKVFILFDVNAANNSAVTIARRALAAVLKKMDAQVSIIDLPALDGVNGPDDYLAVVGDEATAKLFDEPRPAVVGQIDVSTLGEHDLALRFSERSSDLRYVAKWGRWMRYGPPWREDSVLEVFDRARETCCEVIAACDEKQKSTVKWLKQSATRAAVENMCRSDKRHAATVEQWDSDPMILGTPEHVSDLRTGDVRLQRPEDYLTRSIAVAIAESANCPLWLGFLDRITNHNIELQKYLQRVAGYCLTGLTVEHALFFLYGTGGNGKTVFTKTLQGTLGDYAQVAAIETFIETKNEQHPTNVAALRGARLVVASEPKAGQSWDETKIKLLTGGDPIRARFMRSDEFEYIPQFKLLVHGNNRPSLRKVDEAIRRRMHLIPFVVKIPAEERVLGFDEQLKPEWPAVLRWMLDGCLEWQRQGLNPPAVVREATEAYLSSEDSIGLWLEERCLLSPQAGSTKSSELYRDYAAWAEQAREFVMSNKRFSQELESRGFNSRRHIARFSTASH